MSVNLIANTESQYKRLSAVLDRARWEGLLPMDALDDRGRVALTRAQIDAYDLPPQPTKRTDSRARGWHHGGS